MKIGRDGRRLVLLATASVAAFVTADAIYRQAIIPRLPGWQSVPWGWWLLDMAPLILVVACAGLLCTATIKIPLYSLAIVIPPTLLEAARGLLTGAPVIHDTWVTDPGYWVAVGLRLLLFMVVVAVIHGATSGLKDAAGGT
jgi:hypothetical protein